MDYSALLTKSDLAAVGILLPESMAITAYSRFCPAIANPGLLSLLGKDRLTSYLAWRSDSENPDDPENTVQVALHEKLSPVVCYRAASLYYMQGNVQLTETGAVEKSSHGADGIDSTQRTELRVYYEGLAATQERLLREWLEETSNQLVSNQPTRQRISIVIPRNKAKFDY